jgi:hypothetical protein
LRHRCLQAEQPVMVEFWGRAVRAKLRYGRGIRLSGRGRGIRGVRPDARFHRNRDARNFTSA